MDGDAAGELIPVYHEAMPLITGRAGDSAIVIFGVAE